MKKQIILFIGALLYTTINAQELVWQNTFDTPADVVDWTFHDLNNNGNNYTQGKNWYANPADGYKMKEGTQQVLRYSISKLDNTFVPNSHTENDWIVSSEIDLTGASGTIQFAIYWNKIDSRDNGIGRLVFISESPSLEDFQQMYNSENYTGYFNDEVNLPSDPNQFGESIIDISAFAGKKIYIAMISIQDNNYGGFTIPGINIDEMAIYADNYTMATQDIKAKSSVAVYPNPATDVLYLKGADKANVAVYNAVGQRVLSKAVTNGQLNVSVLPKGVYTLSVETNGKPSTTKFIKK